MKDPDSISTIHLKLPFKDHMAIKVEAMKAGKSMNQYIVDLLGATLRPKVIRNARMATPAERAAGGGTVELPPTIIPQPTPVKEEVSFAPKTAEKLNLCKIHGLPLDARGRCLQKGCKYA